MTIKVLATKAKFSVGDRAQRNPKIWGKKYGKHNTGTIIAIQEGKDNSNRKVRGYRFLSDEDAKGVKNEFTGEIQPSKGIWYTENELVPLKK